jgi:hypothetical protein
MAATPEISTRRLAISKANAQMVAIVSVAAFVTVFCLIASKAVFSQNRYQARVTSAKEKAHHQLQDNIKAFSTLQKSYQDFDLAEKNVIGGSIDGTGDNDGPNSKIVLDALPYAYDFPALTSSLEKILTSSNLKVTNITGTDDQLNQQSNTTSPNPKAVQMDFSFTVDDATYASVSQLVTKLQQSIRPIQIDTLELSAGRGSTSMTATVTGHTYFQPIKNVSITKKVVK